MKPKNKLQQQILALSKKLPKITQAQVKWAYQHCIEHFGRRTMKGIISCLECGHEWTNKTTEMHCCCPNCNTKLTITDTRKYVFTDYQYLCIVTTCNEFQVLRFIYIDYKAKAGEKASYFHSEVVQRWILPNGKITTIARLRPMGFYVSAWQFRSELEIRAENRLYNITPTEIYPRQKVIYEINRGGFTGDFYNITPSDFFQTLLTDNKAETLLKTGQTNLFQYFVQYGSLENYWASIRICMRNGYKPEDASIWRDYVDLLQFFNKDLHNAKYVCPKDLYVEHDKLEKKKRELFEREKREKAKLKAIEDEVIFKKLKSKFFGIQFTDGLIQVRVLENIEEYIQEGDTLHHCVFTNDYHLKPDTLILSACLNGKRLETIEISLSKLQVVQCRGFCNQDTKYHDRIIKLVKKNIPKFKKISGIKNK